MEFHSCTVCDMYCRAEHAVMAREKPSTMPGVLAYQYVERDVIPTVFGQEGVVNRAYAPGVHDLWRVVLKALSDTGRTTSTRARCAMQNAEREIKHLFGADPLITCDLPTKFDLANATAIVAALESWRAAASWNALTEEDLEMLEAPVDLTAPNLAGVLRERWLGLSVPRKTPRLSSHRPRISHRSSHVSDKRRN